MNTVMQNVKKHFLQPSSSSFTAPVPTRENVFFDLRRYLLLTFDLQTFDLRRLLNLQPGTWNRTWNLELVNLRTVFLTFDGF